MVENNKMTIGDIAKVKDDHWSDTGQYCLIVEDCFPMKNNKGQAFRVMFSCGTIKTKLARNLEVLNDKL